MKSQYLFFILAFLVGCASYQSKVSESRNLLRQGQVQEAVEKLRVLAEKPSDDQLVYQLDYATALQIAGRYKESAKEFIRADKLVEQNDYHSVSNIVGATLGSEEMIQYKGESFEKFLINTMAAINYVMLDQFDDAIVECRRINEKLSKMKMDGRKPYELSPFAKYLSAILWESDQKWDDAYIAFEQTYKLDPSIPEIGADLIRSAKRARRMDTYEKWKTQFPHVKEDPAWYDRTSGELVLIFQQGWGPEKATRPENHRFPTLVPVSVRTNQVRLEIEGIGKFNSQEVYDVEKVSIKTMNDDYAALVARRIGAMVAKDVAADQIRQKNELLGVVAWAAMHISDRADLRQWSTLPAGIQLIRIPLKAGKYKMHVKGLDYSGNPTNESLDDLTVQVAAGKKSFINFRSLK